MLANDELLSTFDVDAIATEALLFQTGYLTIRRHERVGGKALYRLGYPNREVREGLNDQLLRRLVVDGSRQVANGVRLYRLLEADDVDGLRELFQAFYASIPHQWYTNNDIAEYEGFYASVFYSYFAALGLDVVVEESTSRGPPGHGSALRRPGGVRIRVQGGGAGRRGGRRWRSLWRGATRTSTGRRACASIWWAWSSAANRATWWRSSTPRHDRSLGDSGHRDRGWDGEFSDCAAGCDSWKSW